MNHNFDPQEIAKFEVFAKDWWNPEGSMKLLHQLNPIRLNYIQQWVSLENKSVLDVGCGGGILTESLAQIASNTTGIDLSPGALDVARQHAASLKQPIDYQLIPVETLAEQRPQTYDVITCMEMLEHVPHPESIIKACAQLLKPDGFVFFSTIHRNPKSFLFAIVGAEYLLRLLPKGTHQYAHFIRPSELNEWAKSASLELKDIQGVTYSPFHKTLALSSDISVNYITCYSFSDKYLGENDRAIRN